MTDTAQATELIQTLDRLLSNRSTDRIPHLLSMRRLPRPMRRARRTVTTTSPNPRRSPTEARGAFRSHPRLVETSHSAPAYSSTTHGHLTITTAEETLRLATGSRLCLRSRSKRSSTPSKWYAALQAHVRYLLTARLGDGSPRAVKTSHTFLLMIMHPFLGHGVLANTFQLQHLGLEHTAFTS